MGTRETFSRNRALLIGLLLGLGCGLSGSLSGCMTAYKKSVGANLEQVYTKIYRTDVDMAWQAVLEALKSATLDVSNREAGFILTRWTENTAEKNFSDSYAGAKAYLKAQYRFRVSVAQIFYNGEKMVKVSVQREQMVQRDVLDGWRPIASDSVEESTLLYRIGRIIKVRLKLLKAQEQKTEQETQTLD